MHGIFHSVLIKICVILLGGLPLYGLNCSEIDPPQDHVDKGVAAHHQAVGHLVKAVNIADIDQYTRPALSGAQGCSIYPSDQCPNDALERLQIGRAHV